MGTYTGVSHYDEMYEAYIYFTNVFYEYQVNDGTYIMANSHIAEIKSQRYGLYRFEGREDIRVSSGEVTMEVRDV